MARAETVTLLSLDRLFKIIGLDPLSANQLTSAILPSVACNTVVYQRNWDKPSQAGREEYALAIKQAEDDIAAYVGYWPLPTYTRDELQPTVRPADRTLVAAGGGFYGSGYAPWGGPAANVRWFPKSVTLRYGNYISGGVKAKIQIGRSANVVYSDPDGDGYKELATVQVNTTVTEPCEIHIYDPGESGADSWEIRPITVTIAAGVATITFRREQAVDPALWERLDAGSQGAIDGDDDANFITEVDVYRVYLDPSTQVNLITEAVGCSLCGGSGCESCGWATSTGCITGRDKRLGIITYRPAVWNDVTLQFDGGGYCWREADRMELFYYSGYQWQDAACPTLQMDPFWERTIAMLAMSYLQGVVCDCTAVKTFFNWAQTDLALNDGNANLSYVTANRAMNCPWGTRQGAVQAFARCNQPGRVIPR